MRRGCPWVVTAEPPLGVPSAWRSVAEKVARLPRGWRPDPTRDRSGLSSPFNS